MTQTLSISIGQHSRAGRKPINQDHYGLYIPSGSELLTKGIVAAIADGISSSDVSQQASSIAIASFIDDYYATPDSWSVNTAASRVLQSINAWLYGLSRNSAYRYEPDKGYICTFSGLVLKADKAHLFHAGDSRIYRVSNPALEALTTDHRQSDNEQESYLTRAMGLEQQLRCDCRTIETQVGDTFLLTTDGVYDFLSPGQISEVINAHVDNLQEAAEKLIDMALDAGSDDNLTVQIIRIEQLPAQGEAQLQSEAAQLPLPPALEPGMQFDGFDIIRQLYASSRSHVFLAKDRDSDELVALKTLSTDLEDDPEAIDRFLMEDWIAHRLDNVHCLKAIDNSRQRQYLYTATEYIEGQTLTQWMHDNPEPSLDEVRRIVEQIGHGLQAMHRKEMIHQDIRPDNILLDKSGTVKILDFGSTRIAGIAELGAETQLILGTAQFTAPEYFLGYEGTNQSDIFSLGVLTYHLLTHALPYGTKVSSAYNVAAQRKLSYQSLLGEDLKIPFWVDDTLRKAVHVQPHRRYQEVAEFIYDLNHPNKAFVNKARPPLIERNPVLFWQCISLLLLVALVYQQLA
jgi:serine/threonine protein phosphatase PrpC